MNKQHTNIISSALYIVSTPIGNIEDITNRTLTILQKVNLVAAEDTRYTKLLLKKYSIKTNLLTLHEHNEKQKTKKLLNILQKGKSIALVSKAGTPLISDPGYNIVKSCHKAGIRVVPIPGSCAAITALSVSGLPTDRFCYEGFLPRKRKKRLHYLQTIAEEPRTLIFYESPHRVIENLKDIAITWNPERYVVLAKELTKTWETIYGAPVGKLINWITEEKMRSRGEITLVIEGYKKKINTLSPIALHTLKILMEELPLKKAATLTSQIHSIKKNKLYDYIINQQKINKLNNIKNIYD